MDVNLHLLMELTELANVLGLRVVMREKGGSRNDSLVISLSNLGVQGVSTQNGEERTGRRVGRSHLAL